MSTHLFSNLLSINKSTFIPEDVGFLTSFFYLQKDLPKDKCINSWIWFLMTISVTTTLIDWIYFGSGLSILNTILCLPYVLFNLYYLFYYRFTEYRVKKSFNALCTCLRENHNLLKKLLTLGQELEIIEKNCSLTDANSSKAIKSTFEITVKLFDVLREETKEALLLPATIEDVNREDNYISCLPNQLFDDLLQEENPSPYQLKSLMQLVRIQQSEFLRRILCAHISGKLEEKLKTLLRIVHCLLRCKDKMSPQYFKLKSLYAFHQSSYFQQHQPTNSTQSNGSSFDINYSIRSIRLHLHAALLLLNNIEKEASQDSTKQNCILDDILKIEKELTLGSECLKVLSKRYRKNDNLRSFNAPKAAKPKFVEEPRTVIIGENFQPKIEDQVFELFIDADDDCVDFQCQEVEESTTMFDDFTTISSNLFQELKTALIPKAEETREREAKALGIPKEEVPMQLNSCDNTLKSNKELKIPLTMRQEVKLPNLLNINNNFTSALATRAAQISKDLKLNSSEECFGDSDYDDYDDNVDINDKKAN